jgi:hypothetical protein
MKQLKHTVLIMWISAIKNNTVRGNVTQIFYPQK